MGKKSGVCHVCGCTDLDCRECIEETGEPCHWVDRNHTLCSRCERTAVVNVCAYSQTYIARGEGLQASCTAGGGHAAKACAQKIFGVRGLGTIDTDHMTLDPEPKKYGQLTGRIVVKVSPEQCQHALQEAGRG